MSKTIIIIATALYLSLSVSAVRIEEVYYDPIKSETGGEAIVLFNSNNTEVDISNWTIKSHKLSVDATIPENTKIKSLGYFLITDVDWNNSKDNENWNEADYEEALSLGNTDYGIGLYDNKNKLIDKVGWGNKANIQNEMYYEEPSEKPSSNSGQSILRISNTKNNNNDFKPSEPKIKSSQSTIEINNSQKNIKLNFKIQSNEFHLDNFTFSEDDFEEEGIQIIPFPGKNREIKINLTLTHSSDYNQIKNVTFNGKNITFIQELNQTSAIYQSKINISYNATPKEYNIQNNLQETITYEVKELVAMELDAFNFEIDAQKNNNYFLEGDNDILTKEKPTIKNIGNVAINIGIKTSTFGNDFNPINSKNILYSFDNNDFESDFSGELSNETQLVNLNIKPGLTNELGLKINIPENISDGNYENNIVISASG